MVACAGTSSVFAPAEFHSATKEMLHKSNYVFHFLTLLLYKSTKIKRLKVIVQAYKKLEIIYLVIFC